MVFQSCNFDEKKPVACYCIDCYSCQSLDALISVIARMLEFPAYFWAGNVWDSLVDCLMYMDWIETDNIEIKIVGFRILCEKLNDMDQQDFIQTIQFVAEHCHNTKPSCKALRFILE